MPVFVRKESGLIAPETVELSFVQGNTLLTINQITREALRAMHTNMELISSIRRHFDAGHHGDRIVIRVPEIYRGRA